MDPTQQALLAQMLQGMGAHNSNLMPQAGNMPASPTLGAAGGGPSMGGGSAPAWDAALPPGLSGQALPPSLYSMSPGQAMGGMSGGSPAAGLTPQQIQQLLQQMGQPNQSPTAGFGGPIP